MITLYSIIATHIFRIYIYSIHVFRIMSIRSYCSFAVLPCFGVAVRHTNPDLLSFCHVEPVDHLGRMCGKPLKAILPELLVSLGRREAMPDEVSRGGPADERGHARPPAASSGR